MLMKYVYTIKEEYHISDDRASDEELVSFLWSIIYIYTYTYIQHTNMFVVRHRELDLFETTIKSVQS